MGVVVTFSAFVAAGFIGISLGILPAGADVTPSALEQWAAYRGLNAAGARQAKALRNPLSATEDNLLVGGRLYDLHCAVCHGTSDGQPSRFEQGFYIKAPQFATHGVEKDPENITYWKAEHGIRFTAMPAFKNTMPSDDLWKITMFLKRMDRLPPAVDALWKKLPSVSPAI
jgi:mono/diheme cytochrome c family protein